MDLRGVIEKSKVKNWPRSSRLERILGIFSLRSKFFSIIPLKELFLDSRHTYHGRHKIIDSDGSLNYVTKNCLAHELTHVEDTYSKNSNDLIIRYLRQVFNYY